MDDTKKLALSAVIIAKDEEDNIERCLKSLSFCDEVLVVDAESTDQTREIASRFGARLVTRAWTGYCDQKNYGNDLARHPWILSLDADEEVTPELRREIEALFHGGTPAAAAYTIPRKTWHMGRWIQYGGWYPNRITRLFDKARGKWVGGEVHEYWKTEGTVEQLSADIAHFSFRDLTDQVGRNNLYTSLSTEKSFREGRRFSLGGLLIKPLGKFLETYLLKRGFLDGMPGFIISVSAAYAVFLKWAKLWEIENREKKA